MERPAVGEGRPQQPLAAWGHGCQGIFEAREDRLPEARDTDHVMGTNPLQVILEIAQGCVGLAAAAGEQEIFDTALVGMPDRQHTQDFVTRLGVDQRPQAAHLMQQVAMAEGHPFRFAGGARGVKQGGQSPCVAAGRRRQRCGSALGHKARPAKARQVGRTRGGGGFPLQQHHEPQALAGLGIQPKPGQQGRRFDHQAHRARIGQDVAQFFDRGAAAAYRVSSAAAHQPLVRHQPPGAVFSEQCHHLTTPQPQGRKAGGGLVDALAQGAEADGLLVLGVMGGHQGYGIAVLALQFGPELVEPLQGAPVMAAGLGLPI